MKSKSQKQEELKEAASYLADAKVLVFTDYTGVPAEDMRRLRREIKAQGGTFLAVKKRLFKVLAKDKHLNVDVMQYPAALGVAFGKGEVQPLASSVFRFLNDLGGTDKSKKAAYLKKLLGGYDFSANAEVSAETVLMLGQLPPREVLLGQLFGTMAGPIRAFLYLLDQKSKQPAT